MQPEPSPATKLEKLSGRTAHRSALQSGTHQHYLPNARETMAIKSGDTLYAYIYLDPDHPPQAVMLQWNDGDWNQRAYWGQNLINWGTNGTSSRRYMGRLPASGGWVRLEVPAARVGLAGKTVNGLAFILYGGRAWWDRAGVRRAVHEVTKYYAFNGQRIARRQDGVLTYLHTDHLGSTLLATNSSGAMVGEHRYRAYGSRRGGDELATDHRFTGQKVDGTGLYYDNARYYDPALGAFIGCPLGADTIVPDPTTLLDYNRYSYVRGNPLKYNDPSRHCGTLAVTGGTSAPLDVACWIAMAEAAAAVAAVGTGAVGAGAFLAAGLYGYEQTTFELPDYDHAYDIPGTDLQASSIVNGSSTVRSGVPVIESDVEGFTLLDPPQLEELVVVSFPSDPTSSLKRRNGAYWKKLGLDAHELKSDVPGKLSEFDLYKDAEGYIWALRKNHRGADPHYIGHLDELIEELDN